MVRVASSPDAGRGAAGPVAGLAARTAALAHNCETTRITAEARRVRRRPASPRVISRADRRARTARVHRTRY